MSFLQEVMCLLKEQACPRGGVSDSGIYVPVVEITEEHSVKFHDSRFYVCLYFSTSVSTQSFCIFFY